MSKNTIWFIIIGVSAVVGALLGPAIADSFSMETVLVFLLVFFAGIIAFIIYSLSGNKQSQAATDEQRAVAMTLTPDAGKVRIYVIRTGFVAKLQGMEVAIDDVRHGQMKGGQFLFAELDPGTYTVTGELVRSGKNSGTETEVTLEAGQSAAIKAIIEMGAMAGKVKFSRIRGDEAKKVVEGAKMVLWNTPAT